MDYVTKAVLQESLKQTNKLIEDFIKKANDEVLTATNLSTETKSALETLSSKATDIVDRLLALEQKSLTMPAGTEAFKSLGDQFIEQEGFQKFQNGRAGSMRMELKAIMNQAPLTQNQPLVGVQRVPGIMHEPNRPFTVRDLFPVGRTASNMIEFAKELVYTNNAGPQNGEGTAKPESNITFELDTAPVVTLAHWIPVSKQVLSDSPALLSYINTRLMYGLKLVEEGQLLNGTGAGGQLGGLLLPENHVAFNRVKAGDTPVDTLRRALTQVVLSNYSADAFVLHPADWERIELQKDANQNYLWANPTLQNGPQLWGRRVVPSIAMPEGQFLTGSFTMGAQIWDREEAAIQVSFEDRDNFIKNMATIRAEERLAFSVYRKAAFVVGEFPDA